MKKTIFFMLCLTPLGVQAADVVPEPVSGEAYTGGLIASTEGTVFADGINLTNNMYIGTELPEFLEQGSIYAPNAINGFTLSAGKDITVNNLLEISENASLAFNTIDGAQPINISLGSVNAAGAFSVANVALFSVKDEMSIANGFSLMNSSSMETGGVNVTGGDTIINISGAANIANFSNSGTGNTTTITANTVTIGSESAPGYINNINNAGDININTVGNIDVNGSITNASSTMDLVAGGDIVVSGSVSNSADMVMNATNITVSGGADGASINSSGDLTMIATGTTNLVYGMDLSAMNVNNTFRLETGSLTFGSAVTTDGWLNVFSNKLNSFTLNVTNDELEIKSSVINGLVNDSVENPSYNTGANMSLKADAFTIGGDVNNFGVLNIQTDVGGIIINGDIVGNNVNSATLTTEIAAETNLQVSGDVSNSGVMTLDGQTVSLNSIVNSSGALEVLALTDDTGVITIAKDVTNESGTTYINAKDISIGGALVNKNGTTTIKGSDTNGSAMTIGSIAVQDGSVNLNALVGGVNVVSDNGSSGTIDITGGALNIGNTTYNVVADGSIKIGGNFVLGNTGTLSGNGDVFANASGNQAFVISSDNGSLTVNGLLDASQTGVGAYNATFAAATMTFGQVTAAGASNNLTFGNDVSQQLTVNGNMAVSDEAKVSIVSGSTNVGSLTVGEDALLNAGGYFITAKNGAVNITGDLWFDGVNAKPASGLVVNSPSNNFALKSETAQVEITGDIDLGADNTLSLESKNSAVTVGGNVLTSGVLNASGNIISMGDLTINKGSETVSSAVTLTAAQSVKVGNITANAGTLDIIANSNAIPNIQMGALNIESGAFVNIDSNYSANVAASDNVVVSGNVVQGTSGGALNILTDNVTFAGLGMQVTGNYSAASGSALFELANDVIFEGEGTGNVTIAAGASTTFNVNSFSASNINNNGSLVIVAEDGITLAAIDNTGTLELDSGAGIINAGNFAANDIGTIEIKGNGLTSADVFSTKDSGMLYQNYADVLPEGSINIVGKDYTINASQFAVGGIEQVSGELNINADMVNIIGDVEANNLRFGKTASDAWADISIDGNVSGGVDFWGIKQLNIGGNYTFSNNSDLWAAIMPYDDNGAGNTSSQNYWSTIEATSDNKVGEITNAENGSALINVEDKFISNITGVVDNTAATAPQVGITLFDIVDQGTAIWLLHAENGIEITDAFEKLRNLDVKFCNADGTQCINYLDTLKKPGFGQYNGSDSELPVYVSERDTDGDGVADSLYVVFDPSFGGPVEVFKLQPIVGAAVPHTEGEYVSAGALDDLIAGQLINTKFNNNSPIEVIPQIFKGTNLAEMADELYDRMEYYNMTGENAPLARFSRLFQARELEQLSAMISLNEHTSFRDFEDRMFDEFIWNRNRNLKKAWLDIDYGFFSQKETDSIHANGTRFNISGGFDWQHSETTIFGLTARVSNSSGDASDTIELGYLPNQSLTGTVDITVDDLDIGLGGYMMKTLGEKTRLYGNAFLDIHMLDVSRDQTFMGHIEGDGTAFSLISEWGLLHDWLNQYIVGNMYARVGYNFGFDITEKAAGQNYMDLQSDGYFILTPGYSLIAQKRIYPSAWFQIRPYASIGVEYDVLGTPNDVKYKFALAHSYTDYDVDVDPLWANIGGGIEMLSASGFQVGIDYRYQYNNTIQLHNIKISGSYRF